MPPRLFTSIKDLEAAIGEELGPTDWVHVDQQTVNRFADLTNDHQWIHTNPERAASSPFGYTIMHGCLTLSMLPGFASRLYSIQTGTARLNYGLDKVRFLTPVPVGSSIRPTATIKHVQAVRSGIRAAFSWTVEAQNTDRPVCVAESITLIVH